MKQPTLLILAAGIGSRYGGLKQADGMGPGGETILEYSVHDAIEAGFGKVVFVIRPEIEADFREIVGRKIEPRIRTQYTFQEIGTGLEWLGQMPHRKKPWGTGHAIFSAKDCIEEPFVAINADDFYGADAFKAIGKFLREDCSPAQYGMVAYQIGNTLSENGSVSRGVCAVSPDGFLTDVVERHNIRRDADGIHFSDETGRYFLPDNTPVSMNFWGFHPTIFGEIETQFREFVLANKDNPSAEFYIPKVVNTLVKAGKVKVKVLNSASQWYGVTYPEDKNTVQAALKKMVAEEMYEPVLW
ncbi:MAG: nucleotidyltransferase [Saprospiraceae bacterium]|nr:nucleotidyltransferase [Saprospiraceae bacterium]